MARAALIAAVAAAVLGAAGCGEKEVVVTPPQSAEGADPPAAAPAGWRTHADAPAGLSLALPRDWTIRRTDGALRLEAPGRALIAALQADRSEEGRTTPAADYALATLAALPGYRELEGRTARPPRSPYEAARVSATGTRAGHGARQHVSVTALRLPGTVTFTAVAFSDPAARSQRRALDRALATLRAGADQRSGRSG